MFTIISFSFLTIVPYICLGWVIYNMLYFLITKYLPSYSFILCPKCITFWFTLLITFNPLIAATVSFANFLIDKYIPQLTKL